MTLKITSKCVLLSKWDNLFFVLFAYMWQECICLVPKRALEIVFGSGYTDGCLEFETSHLVSISVKEVYYSVISVHRSFS